MVPPPLLGPHALGAMASAAMATTTARRRPQIVSVDFRELTRLLLELFITSLSYPLNDFDVPMT